VRHNPHAPANPSQLREVYVPSEVSSSPGDTMRPTPARYDNPQASSSTQSPHDVETMTDGIQPPGERIPVDGQADGIVEIDLEPSAHARLLNQDWDAASTRSYGTIDSALSKQAYGRSYPGAVKDARDSADATEALLGDRMAEGELGGGDRQKKSTTKWLADRYGIKNQRLMYLAYYIPILNWAGQYRWRYLKGDLIAALTMASFYIPMALSYASNLAHLPPIHGLYAFAINPLIYGILGSCPQMIVGPEAPGSLLTGEVVRENIKKGTTGDDDGRRNAEIAGIVTCMAGAFILVAGIFRLGFLDNVLSRPFLRGFISAIGVVIFVDQLIPEMGLSKLAADQVSHGSCLDKIVFLVTNVKHAHRLTCAMSFGAFAIIMFFR
jgi:hypothetical protein